MSLYTKYRPRDWDNVVDQDAVTSILRYSLENNLPGHAYIFTGSRGTGKTTSARIFAKALNCQNLQKGNPCHQCENCLSFDAGNMSDIVEIDGASHTQVENIRSIIEEAKYLPMYGNYKIYIIDEVHMLSNGAFNALLKTLEEPPAHIKFILATTEIHKIPETIQSRAQRFDFDKISLEGLLTVMKNICQKEWIQAEENALKIIAKTARGGMRDALKMLEQYSINNILTTENLEKNLSILDENFIWEIIEHLKNQNIIEIKNILAKISEKKVTAQTFFDQILYTLRDKLFENLGKNDFLLYEKIFEIFSNSYSSVKNISDDNLLIEITIMRAFSWISAKEIIPIWVKNEKKESETFQTKREISQEHNKKWEEIIIQSETKSEDMSDIKKKITEKLEQSTEISKQNNSEENLSQKENSETSAPMIHTAYRNFLDSLKIDPTVLATVKTATFRQKNYHVTFICSNKWNADKLRESRYQNVILEALQKTFWGIWTISSESGTPTIDNTFVDDVF